MVLITNNMVDAVVYVEFIWAVTLIKNPWANNKSGMILGIFVMNETQEK